MTTCNACGREFKNGAGLGAHQRFSKCVPLEVTTKEPSIIKNFKQAYQALLDKRILLLNELHQIDEQLKDLKMIAISYEKEEGGV